MSAIDSKKDATRVTLVGMFLDIGLGLGKIIGGLLTQSFALIADGIHSLSDAVTDIFVLIVTRVAHDDPDEEHPYGHGRFETLGTISMGVVFFCTSGIILFDSYRRLQLDTEIPIPAVGGIAIALISIACKEWVYHYTMRVAKRLNSSLLKANAWHSRSDAISSVAVLIGLVAARQGYVWMDTVAAIFVALIIAKVGWELCADSLRELVDTAIPAKRRMEIETFINSVEGVKGITSLRSRSSGGKILLEAHLLVNPRISVSEGHQLGERVSKNLTGKYSDIQDVLVHIDPEMGETSTNKMPLLAELPHRAELIKKIDTCLYELIDKEDIESVDLHYLEHGIEVDLTIRNTQLSEELVGKLTDSIATIEPLASLRIFKKLHEINIKPQLS